MRTTRLLQVQRGRVAREGEPTGSEHRPAKTEVAGSSPAPAPLIHGLRTTLPRRASFLPREELVFTLVEGRAVPCQPWPQLFYVSRRSLQTDEIELRPLTVTGLLKGIGRNFVTMNFWRLCYVLRGLGFLKTEDACRYHWRDLTLRFWRYQNARRFRWTRHFLR